MDENGELIDDDASSLNRFGENFVSCRVSFYRTYRCGKWTGERYADGEN